MLLSVTINVLATPKGYLATITRDVTDFSRQKYTSDIYGVIEELNLISPSSYFKR